MMGSGRARFGSAALAAALGAAALYCASAFAQTPPNRTEIRDYKGLLSSVIRDDFAETRRLLADGANPNAADANGRTPLIIAAHRGRVEMARVLVAGGADPLAKDNQNYDIITIAAVNNDLPFLKAAIGLGADPKAITSPYDGTALIAAAHLGHHQVCAELIMAGAPLDHVNNIAMTALIEAIVLGDGGPNHQQTVRVLLDAGANPNIADRTGNSPLTLARGRGYNAMADRIVRAGGR